VNSRFLAVAKDPTIIPGVHHHCDEWCDYCAVTHRCLAFRCIAEWRKQRRRSPADPPFASMDDAAKFIRELADAEGMRTDELDAMRANPSGLRDRVTSDPLESTAWEYAIRVAVIMLPVAGAIAVLEPRPAGPAPEEIVLWCHLRIYMSVFQALVCAERRLSTGNGADDALGSAKRTIVMAVRSRRALRAMRTEDRAAEIDALVSLLIVIEQGIDERFPGARSFVRLGLDAPVG
jgi:hypothetical protein